MPCCRSAVCSMVYSFIGITLGISAFICFTFFYSNYQAGVLALYSGVLAIFAFHLHRLYYKNILQEWYSTEMIGKMELFAFIGTMVGFAFTIWYIFREIYYKTPMLPADTSDVIRIVWSFMTFKWGMLLFCASRGYSNVDGDHVVLTNTPDA